MVLPPFTTSMTSHITPVRKHFDSNTCKAHDP